MALKTTMSCFLVALSLAIPSVASSSWTLTDNARRAHIEYYSPIIFKRSNEDSSDERGLDLVTNFDFDRDGRYANNKRNWEDIYRFVDQDSATNNWRIRPTLYTSIIEFMEGASKSIILLYHVYHAKQETSIHDWERIEIRVDHVNPTPGAGDEQVNYVAITEHSDHKVRRWGHSDLNFMSTTNGLHPMIWQAQWSGNYPEPRRAELRFVEDSWSRTSSRVSADKNAEVEVNGTSKKKNVNYVFVCDCDSSATSYWDSETISQSNASTLVAGVRETVDWDDVPRVNYELQDLADILPSHTSSGSYWKHWKSSPYYSIYLASAITSESGTTEVSSGWQNFYYIAKDDEDSDESREGYPDKSWFWGAYDFAGNTNLKSKVFEGRTGVFQGGTRGQASGRTDSHSSYWWQHDYFAHSGQEGSGSNQLGRWLPSGWYTSSNGGFDGRWVQLFQD